MDSFEMVRNILKQHKSLVLMETFEFQERLFMRLKNPDFPIIEKLRMISIIHSNIKEHFSMKLSKSNKKLIKKAAYVSSNLYSRMGNYTELIMTELVKLHPEVSAWMQVCKCKELIIVSDKVEYTQRVIMRADEFNQEDSDDIIINIPYLILNIEDIIDYILDCIHWQDEKEKGFKYDPAPIQIIEDEDLEKGDIILRTPVYDNYETVVQFIEQTLNSGDYHLYMMTLYRVGKPGSKLIEYLCEASRKGKIVIVYVECTASGDEKKNEEVIRILREAGVIVRTSCKYKVHAKMFLAISNITGGKMRAHFSTGNYNLSSVNCYTDIQCITSDKKKIIPAYCTFINNICELNDKSLSISKAVPNYDQIWFSPVGLKEKIVSMINREIKKGSNGHIIIKSNSLAEPDIISTLYAAVDADVNVKLIVRSICLMDPMPCSNLQIISYCGRYLEHDRIYIFGDDVFISSADLSFRNMHKRIECLIKIDGWGKERIINRIANMPNEIGCYYEKISTGDDYMWIEKRAN